MRIHLSFAHQQPWSFDWRSCRSKFSCGSISSYDDHDDVLKESAAVAKCQFNEDYFTNPISYKEMKAVKIGVFHATW